VRFTEVRIDIKNLQPEAVYVMEIDAAVRADFTITVQGLSLAFACEFLLDSLVIGTENEHTDLGERPTAIVNFHQVAEELTVRLGASGDKLGTNPERSCDKRAVKQRPQSGGDGPNREDRGADKGALPWSHDPNIYPVTTAQRFCLS
jgi:hypothetical protein